jgi:hypothetical protein
MYDHKAANVDGVGDVTPDDLTALVQLLMK